MEQWFNDLAETLSLEGEWEFTLGDQKGVIQVPGCWEAQGYARHLDGPAHYRRLVHIPAAWAGRTIQLQFDAVSYHVEVSLNGKEVGSHTGLWSPFAFDITDLVLWGRENEIRLTLYKPGHRFPMRESLAGFLPDVCTPFGGLWQPARIIGFHDAALSQVTIDADFESGEVQVSALIRNGLEREATVLLVTPSGAMLERSAILVGDRMKASFVVEAVEHWGPEQPALYEVVLKLSDETGTRALTSRRFGFRRLFAVGEQLHFNYEPICLRGVLNWGWYPARLCPAPNDEVIRDEFRRVRALGFNMVKLCLYVPSPRYFEIADEEGMLLWLELPMWLPQVTERLRQQAPVEYAEILAALHHHPSIIIYSLGCELNQSVDAALLERLETVVRARVQGALFCDNSGSGEAYGGLSYDLADFNDYHFYADLHYFDPLIDHFSRDWRPPRPWIFGEFCDADDYRDLDEIEAAMGGALPWWLSERNPLHPLSFIAYPEQRVRMSRLDLDFDHQSLMRISRQQSFVLRKTILEKVRSRAGMGGYVVTGIRDTPLATSSVFDDLGRTKYPVEAFRAFNDDVVLLLGRGRARTWTHGGDRPAPFEPYSFLAGQRINLDLILSNAGPVLPGGVLSWTVGTPHEEIIAQDSASVDRSLPGGRPYALARVTFDAPPLERAAEYQLNAVLTIRDRRITNSWPLWLYPAVSHWPENLGLYDPNGVLRGLDDLNETAKIVPGSGTSVSALVTSVLDENVIAFLLGGGRALLLQQGEQPLPALAVPFWREGVKLLYPHPALDSFPHRGHVDLQFYGLATDWALETNAVADVLPDVRVVRPLLRRLDARQFTTADYLAEIEVGAGRFIATTLRFQGGSGDQPVGLRRHFAARWLLLQLLRSLEA